LVGALNADAKVGSLNQWHELPAEILNSVMRFPAVA
jgi:hypothetical protein